MVICLSGLKKSKREKEEKMAIGGREKQRLSAVMNGDVKC